VKVAVLVFLFFTAFFLTAQPRTVPEGEWYRSNALGALLEETQWFRREEWEWVVQKKARENGDTLILYQNNVALETRIRDFDEEKRVRKVKVIRKNQTRELYDLDETGMITREEFWVEGRKTGEVRYVYENGVLLGRQFRGINNRLEWTDEIFRTPTGRIRRVVRTGNQGAREWNTWSWGTRGLGTESGLQGVERFFSAYEPGGLVRRRELSIGNELTQVSEFQYLEGVVVRRVDQIVPEGFQETRRFDGEGRLILLEIRRNSRLSAQERRTYTSDLLSQIERVSGGVRELRSLTYNEKNELIKEEIRQNEVLQGILMYEDEKLVLEEVYLDGRKVILILWENGEKVEETYFDSSGNSRVRDPRRSS